VSLVFSLFLFRHIPIHRDDPKKDVTHVGPAVGGKNLSDVVAAAIGLFSSLPDLNSIYIM
jgi:hypothetical protein